MLSNAIYYDKGKSIPFNFPAHISTIWGFSGCFSFFRIFCIGVTTQEGYIPKPSTSHNLKSGKVWRGTTLQILAPKVIS